MYVDCGAQVFETLILTWQIESRPQRKMPLHVVDDSNN